MYNVPLWAEIFLPLGLSLLTSVEGQNLMTEYPGAEISNGLVKMKLYLPDPEKGYYRGTRFDWSGVISQVEYQGHNYFAEWKTTHNPAVPDDIVGPVEEFKTGPSSLGYKEAKVGEPFLKIGVGLLEKPHEPAYRSSHAYKIIRPGTWKVSRGKDWIEFQQNFKDESGWGYLYTKRISLAKDKPEFTIAHSLKNRGSKFIDTSQYNHNFFVIDGTPIGKSYVLRFPFAVKTARDLKGVMEAKGNELIFNQDLEKGYLFSELKGFRDDAKDHEITVENKKTGAGVRIKGDNPIVQLNFWTIKTTLCPEPHVEIKLAPGEEKKWKTEYFLYTLGNER